MNERQFCIDLKHKRPDKNAIYLARLRSLKGTKGILI